MNMVYATMILVKTQHLDTITISYWFGGESALNGGAIASNMNDDFLIFVFHRQNGISQNFIST